MRKIVWELDAESATFYMLLASYCRRPTREEKSIPLSLRLQHTKEWKIQRSVFFFNAPMFASSTTNETNSLPPRFQQWRDEKKEKILGKGTCKIHYNKINCVLEFRLKLVTYFSVNRLDLTQKKKKSDRNEISIDKQKLNSVTNLRIKLEVWVFFFHRNCYQTWSDCFANKAPNRVRARALNINSIRNFKYHNNHPFISLSVFFLFNCVTHAVMTFYF